MEAQRGEKRKVEQTDETERERASDGFGAKSSAFPRAMFIPSSDSVSLQTLSSLWKDPSSSARCRSPTYVFF